MPRRRSGVSRESQHPKARLRKIVAVGDTLGGEVITDVVLDHLNDAGELSVTTVSASGARVWRFSGLSGDRE